MLWKLKCRMVELLWNFKKYTMSAVSGGPDKKHIGFSSSCRFLANMSCQYVRSILCSKNGALSVYCECLYQDKWNARPQRSRVHDTKACASGLSELRFFLAVNSFVLIIYSCSGRPAQILIPSTAFTFVCRNWNINANLLTNIRAQLILTKQFTCYINESLPYSWSHGSSIYSTIYLLE